MISLAAGALLSLVEKEIANHSPEIQDYLLKELQTIGELILRRVTEKMGNKNEQEVHSESH